MSVKELQKKIKKASDAYYNDEQIMEDDEFDMLVDELRKLDPQNLVLKQIGAPIRKDVEKVKLPYYMGSLDKIKPDTREFDLWFERHHGPYFVSLKLDGVSGMVVYNEKGEIKIYTRGDGDVGQDISFLKHHLKLPEVRKKFAVRGEFIMKRKVFEKNYSNDYPKARSVVNGVINSKKPSLEILNDIDFLIYEIIFPEGCKWSKQFEVLQKMKFLTPEYMTYKVLDVYLLQEKLATMKKTSIYEIDGLVVSEDKKYERITSGKPSYSIAFKVNSEGIDTVVEEVIWNPSKYGVLVPKVKVKPVILDGDTVTYASASNAKFIEDNDIGKGTKVKIIKSGDVIPFISKIVKSTGPDFPKVKYHWNETRVNIILDEEDEEIEIKRLLSFFQILRIENLSIGMVNKLFKGGFNTPKKIFEMSKEDMMTLPAVKEKSSERLYTSIHQVMDHPIPLERVMASSLAFGNGFGEKRLTVIAQSYPDILSRKIEISDITKLEGFSDKTAEKFVENFPEFLKFLKENPYFKFGKTELKKGKMTGEVVVFSGFRDKELKEKIISDGGEVSETLTKKTTLLVVKDDKETTKTKKAKELGVKIVLVDEF